jgi:hypothetical protein
MLEFDQIIPERINYILEQQFQVFLNKTCYTAMNSSGHIFKMEEKKG